MRHYGAFSFPSLTVVSGPCAIEQLYLSFGVTVATFQQVMPV